jgi:hypothetical protein
MKQLKALLTAVLIMLAGMYGGQKNKGVRRFGIPGLAIIASFVAGFRWKDLAFLLLIPVLCMGYGVDSVYMKIFKVEWLVRFMYGLTLSIPFIVYGLTRYLVAAISLACVFLIRAGSLGYITWFGDILIEDICRYSTLGVLIAFNVFYRKDLKTV